MLAVVVPKLTGVLGVGLEVLRAGMLQGELVLAVIWAVARMDEIFVSVHPHVGSIMQTGLHWRPFNTPLVSSVWHSGTSSTLEKQRLAIRWRALKTLRGDLWVKLDACTTVSRIRLQDGSKRLCCLPWKAGDFSRECFARQRARISLLLIF